MISSYEKNNYGPLLRSLSENCVTSLAVELGVLHGYSTEYIAWGVLGKGRLMAYDLFEEYEYNHSKFNDIRVKFLNFGDTVKLIQGDAFKAHNDFEDASVGFLHVDLSNTGDIIKEIINNWNNKIAQRGIIVFEGGSFVRDNIEWMKKYNKSPIRAELENNKIINEQYLWGVFEAYPSMTVMYKKEEKHATE